jgi:Ca2+-binding EF-hand superfamily protein
MMTRTSLLACAIAVGLSTGAVAATANTMAKPVKAESGARANALTTKFKAWDLNHDGTLTQAELVRPTMSKKNQQYAERVIASADRNHDGKIGPKEFSRSVEARLARIEG